MPQQKGFRPQQKSFRRLKWNAYCARVRSKVEHGMVQHAFSPVSMLQPRLNKILYTNGVPAYSEPTHKCVRCQTSVSEKGLAGEEGRGRNQSWTELTLANCSCFSIIFLWFL